jgi:hypothetical protein
MCVWQKIIFYFILLPIINHFDLLPRVSKLRYLYVEKIPPNYKKTRQYAVFQNSIQYSHPIYFQLSDQDLGPFFTGRTQTRSKHTRSSTPMVSLTNNHTSVFLPMLWIRIRWIRIRIRIRRSLQLSKENKERNVLTFLYFCGTFLPSWIRIQGSH